MSHLVAAVDAVALTRVARAVGVALLPISIREAPEILPSDSQHLASSAAIAVWPLLDR